MRRTVGTEFGQVMGQCVFGAGSGAVDRMRWLPDVYGGNGLRGHTNTFTYCGDYPLIGRQGALCGNINYASGEFWASEHAIVVVPSHGVDVTWLGEVLREMNLNQYSIASAQPGLSVDNIRKLPIAVPTKPEQKAIGLFLLEETAKIDGLIEEQRRLIELLKEKRQAVISHAVTSTSRSQDGNTSVSFGWSRLRHHVIRIDQGWSPVALDRDPEASEWAVLKLSAVKRGEFDPTKIKALSPEAEIPTQLELQDGDFLITRANTPDIAGDSCHVSAPPSRLIFSDLIYRVFLARDTMSGEFLNLALQSTFGRAQARRDARGSSQSMVKLGHDHILNWLVPLIPLNEQEQIVKAVNDQLAELNRADDLCKQLIPLLQELRSALVSAAVCGKIDVRNYTSREAA